MAIDPREAKDGRGTGPDQKTRRLPPVSSEIVERARNELAGSPDAFVHRTARRMSQINPFLLAANVDTALFYLGSDDDQAARGYIQGATFVHGAIDVAALDLGVLPVQASRESIAFVKQEIDEATRRRDNPIIMLPFDPVQAYWEAREAHFQGANGYLAQGAREVEKRCIDQGKPNAADRFMIGALNTYDVLEVEVKVGNEDKAREEIGRIQKKEQTRRSQMLRMPVLAVNASDIAVTLADFANDRVGFVTSVLSEGATKKDPLREKILDMATDHEGEIIDADIASFAAVAMRIIHEAVGDARPMIYDISSEAVQSAFDVLAEPYQGLEVGKIDNRYAAAMKASSTLLNRLDEYLPDGTPMRAGFMRLVTYMVPKELNRDDRYFNALIGYLLPVIAFTQQSSGR